MKGCVRCFQGVVVEPRDILASFITRGFDPELMTRTVSICIPTRDGGELFEHSLRSIRSQVFNGDLEVLVIDSGSRDGTAEAAERLSRVLIADPGTGVRRHADAGYGEASQVASEPGVDLPMLGEKWTLATQHEYHVSLSC